VGVPTSEGFESDAADLLVDRPPGVNFTWFSIAPAEDRFLAIEKQSGRTPKVTELDAIALHCASLPVLDSRPAEEILGYDELGLPR
jgi:antitoxin VapB